MLTEVVYVVMAIAVIAAILAFVVYTNKSKARKFFLEHYSATEAESIKALHGLANSAAFASLNAASICLAIKDRSNLPGLQEDELRRRFDALWSEKRVMKAAHALEIAKKLNDTDTFKEELSRLARNPNQV